jgi:hypothetical protein
LTSYFYDDYILGKDTVVFRQEPYFQSGHIMRKKHLVENWADIVNVSYDKQQPQLFMNMIQSQIAGVWNREKPILLLQTGGGQYQGQSLNYTWTRDMPIDLANHVANKYQNDYHIIQLTREGGYVIPNVEVVNYQLTNMELIGLVGMSTKRVLIDSSAQHAAAGFGLPSVVFWVGTSPQVFGYGIHTNIVAKQINNKNHLIGSYLFDFQFDYNVHECPYSTLEEMFDINDVITDAIANCAVHSMNGNGTKFITFLLVVISYCYYYYYYYYYYCYFCSYNFCCCCFRLN